MAQLASRSSVELYTTLYFSGKTLHESAYILRILKNGFVVLIPKYGVEGIVYAARPNEPQVLNLVDEHLETADGVTLKLFQKVKVEITVVEQGNASTRSKLNLRLMEPFIAGLSEVVEVPERATKKRKTNI
jgi:exosome complex exonuclease DIS3/RRP44